MKERTARGAPKAKPTAAPRPAPARGDDPTPPEPRTRRTAGPRSEPARLAAEVTRLEAELAAMRAHVAELEASAERDPLTDLLNRRGFGRELARAIAYLGRYAGSAVLVYLDLDRFKPVNDRHGHAAGDAVLQAVAKTLTRHVRASDSVARLGGDEFAVLLWNLGEADASAKAMALEAEIARTPIAWNGLELSIAASAGMVPVSSNDAPAEVVARADAAMYARKTTNAGGLT
jgi:diguanylate cyclase (GGDEF)-like protein